MRATATSENVKGWCSMAGAVSFVLLFAATVQAKDDTASEQAAQSRHERILQIYSHDAAEYAIYRDASRKERVELRREPVLVCSNPTREGGDGGSSCGPAVAAPRSSACSFRSRRSGRASSITSLIHCRCQYSTCRDSGRTLRRGRRWLRVSSWQHCGAPPPARSAAQRLSQMRALARDFSASTKDRNQRHLELRPLPQPLFRYESTDPDVLDGALFAFVTSTDPEALLIIEARKPAPADGALWQYAICRMTDLELHMRHKGKEVFAAPLIPYGTLEQDSNHRFRVYHDRDIPPVEGTKTP